MPQYILCNPPVILSKHKRDVISHGRPLSPLGSFRSISPYTPRQVVKGSFLEEKHGDTCSLKPPISVPSTSLGDYQKCVQENLISINNNLSSMLQETCSGIDSICQKVRMCLMEANTTKYPNKLPEVSGELNCFLTESKPDTSQQLSICEEESQDSVASHDEIEEIEHESEKLEADLVEEEVVTKTEEPNEAQGPPNSTTRAQRTPSLTPFMTILNPVTKSAESVGVSLIKSITSKLGLSRKCTGTNFLKTMKEVEKLSDYEDIMTTMVDDINKEIRKCYPKSPSTEENISKEQNKKVFVVKRPKSYSSDRFHRLALNQIHEIKKIQKDMTEDQFSESDLMQSSTIRKKNGLVFSGKLDFSQPDVYRKRAITDLHQRLLAQLEANDSFIFFQKLMAKNKKYFKKNRSDDAFSIETTKKSPTSAPIPIEYQQGLKRPRSRVDLVRKYQDSLWFRQKHEKKRKRSEKKTKKELRLLPQTYTLQSSTSNRKSPKSSMSLRKISKSKESTLSVANTQPCKCQISVTNNMPLSEPDRCRLHWMRAKYSQLSHRKLKYIDILDDITYNDLLPFKPEYPRRDTIKRIDNIKESYLYKLLYGKGKGNKKAWSHLLEPKKPGSKENNNKEEIIINEEMEVENAVGDFQNDRTAVVKKLSKYIFSEITSKPENNVYTIMPVHVVYDDSRLSGSNRRIEGMPPQKLPLLPMKEVKDIAKRGEFMVENKKPRPKKVIYDPILRKIEKEIRLASARHDTRGATSKLAATGSWSPKNFPHYQSQPVKKSPQKMDTVDKVPQRYNQRLPYGTKASPQISEIYKRTGGSRESIEQLPPHFVPPLWKTSNFDQSTYRRDTNVQKKIKKELETQISKNKQEQDRKIWQNKYGKSVGQKLLNFIEKQPDAYEVPVPKYALPKPVKNPSKSQQMLQQLQTLKSKNSNIKNNIQRAIEVIENKMVDILSQPTTSQSMEAFEEMEKEITQVLSLMKEQPVHGGVNEKSLSKINEHEKDVSKISEELFQKLDKILESPGISSSGISSVNSPARGDKSKKKTKPKICTPGRSTGRPAKSTDMNQLCFSSTSTSGEEKFTITAISPNRGINNVLRPPYVKVTETPIEHLEAELKKLKEELRSHSSDSVDLEKIDENILRKEEIPTIVVNDREIKPLKEQVVNIALINTGQKCSGDPINSPIYHSSSTEDATYSIGDDGDNLNNINNNLIVSTEDEKAKSNEKLQELKTAVQKNDTQEEQSGSYFTPRATPPFDENKEMGRNCPIERENETKIVHNTNEVNSDEEITYDKEEFGESTENQEESEEGTIESNCFYKNVNRIISRVESVYNQLEQFEEEMRAEELTSSPKLAVFHDPPKIEEIEADAFLTPFMHAVKDLRKSVTENSSSPQSSPRIHSRPSLFNVLHFLDNLTEWKEDRPIEVYTPRVINYAYVFYIPKTFYFSWAQNFSQLSILQDHSNVEEIADLPKKKSGCLKNPSSHLSVCSSGCKSKPKVSFLLKKEEKSTQVKSCPSHSPVKIFNGQVSTESSVTRMKNAEVTAYLDVKETKDVDKMSTIDDDDTFQSTLEFSDEISEKNQIQEEFIENIQENPKIEGDISKTNKNILEIYRNPSPAEKSKENIKIFYDDYQKDRGIRHNKLISGSYNELTIQKIQKSLHKDIKLKKRDSLDRIAQNLEDTDTILKELLTESSLFEPLNVESFIDSKLLKEAIEQRQKTRMMRRKSSSSIIERKTPEGKNEYRLNGDKENLLKGFYVFVYLLMFTALNLEYKCVQ